MSSLIQIVQDANKVEALLMESGGEITEEIASLLAVKELSLPEKVDAYSVVLEKMGASETYLKERAKMFSTAAKQMETAQSNLKERLKYAMQELGTSELKGNDIRFKLSTTSGSLVIEDKDAVPLEFKGEVVETVIDKKALKAAIEKGQEVPGAKIEPGFSLRMFVNKELK